MLRAVLFIYFVPMEPLKIPFFCVHFATLSPPPPPPPFPNVPTQNTYPLWSWHGAYPYGLGMVPTSMVLAWCLPLWSWHGAYLYGLGMVPTSMVLAWCLPLWFRHGAYLYGLRLSGVDMSDTIILLFMEGNFVHIVKHTQQVCLDGV